jgi:hypothetical protein
MEQNLSERFARVAHRFGSGLRNVVKGSILGISLGLLSKLLNPLEALEDKIKKLLGEGTDVKDLADKLNTSGGQLKQAQDVAQSLGVSPEEFKGMLLKYSEAIDKAREEIANPFAEKSASTETVRQFVAEEDKVKSFLQFIGSLKATGEGKTTDEALSDRAKRLMSEAKGKLDPTTRKQLLDSGELRTLSGLETRRQAEKNVFGESQSAGSKRLIEANIPEALKRLNEPSIETLNQAIEKTAQLDAQKRANDTRNATQDFVAASNKLSGKMIEDISKADKAALDKETRQLDSYNDLKSAAVAIEQVKTLFQEVTILANKGIGHLGEMASFIGSLRNNRVVNGLLGRKE